MSDPVKPESNKGTIFVVVITLAVNATLGVGTLAYCLLTGRDINVALYTGFIGIVNYILGVLSGMLIKSSPTATTTEPKPVGTITVPEQQLDTTK